jgi:hypothetical protein
MLALRPALRGLAPQLAYASNSTVVQALLIEFHKLLFEVRMLGEERDDSPHGPKA